MAKAKSKRNVGDDLFQAILDDPDNDTPRLVYADWLEENGNPERAEFIRVQCELAGIAGDDPRRADLTIREDELLAQFGKTWLQELPVEAREGASFRRGFVDSLALSSQCFEEHAHRFFQTIPLQGICFGNEMGPSQVYSGAFDWALVRIRHLNLPGNSLVFTDSSVDSLVERLLRSEVTRLESLGGFTAGRPTWLTLIKLPGWAYIRSLSFALDLLLLPISDILPQLNKIEYVPYRVQNEDVEQLAHCPEAVSLTRLSFFHIHLGFPSCASILASSPYLVYLESLRLFLGYFNNEDAKAIADSPSFGNLTELHLGFTHLTEEGMEALTQSTRLPRLTKITFGRAPEVDSKKYPMWQPQWSNAAELRLFHYWLPRR
ncbi:MAG: TIGR02996 domain-containing protein [Gemmataceae bacterium]